MSAVEAFALKRRRLLLAGTATYAIWCGAFVLGQSGWFHGAMFHLLDFVFTLFFLPWLVVFIWLFSWSRRVTRQPQVAAALNDEYTVRNRWRAQRAAATTLLVSLLIGVLITSFEDVSARFAMLALIWIMVVSQLGFYLWYDRD